MDTASVDLQHGADIVESPYDGWERELGGRAEWLGAADYCALTARSRGRWRRCRLVTLNLGS